MKSRIIRHTPFAIVQICLVFVMTSYCQSQAGDPAKNSARASARGTYNRTLQALLRDLELAKTTDDLSTARSRARQGFNSAVAQDASYPLPYFNLGVLAEADEDWKAAITYFEQFRRLEPTSELAARALAKLQSLTRLQQTDRTPEGRKKRQYDEALSTINALLNLGLMKEAISTAARAALIDDTRWELYALIGNALADRRLYVDATSYLEKAVQRAPKDLRASLLRVLDLCRKNLRASLPVDRVWLKSGGYTGFAVLTCQSSRRSSDHLNRS